MVVNLLLNYLLMMVAPLKRAAKKRQGAVFWTVCLQDRAGLQSLCIHCILHTLPETRLHRGDQAGTELLPVFAISFVNACIYACRQA